METPNYRPENPTLESSIAVVMKAWQLNPQDHEFGSDVTNLILEERQVPVVVNLDTSLRAKVIDSCGMTCSFCHNEGTPVASDALRLSSGLGRGALSGRVSVFSSTNGVKFIPGRMQPNQEFGKPLEMLRDSLELSELHLTGGEPSLNKDLSELISIASGLGYRVKMTSNGENGARFMNSYAQAGLKKVNFSIFGTTPNELASVQNEKYADIRRATLKLNALHRSIGEAVVNNIEVAANVVVPDDTHHERLYRILDEFAPQLDLRLLPDLDAGNSSYYAIYKFLSDVDAKPVEALMEAGSSNARVKYVLPDGRNLHFKQIRPVRLPESCLGCEFNSDEACKEGYYGVRLYVDDQGSYKVGVCIQRMDMTSNIDTFENSGVIEEIKNFKNTEYNILMSLYSEKHI